MKKSLVFIGDPSLLKIKAVSAAQGAAVTYASLSHLKDPYVFAELSRQLRSGECKMLILPEKVSPVTSSVFDICLNNKSNSEGSFSFYVVDDVAAAGAASAVAHRDFVDDLSLALSIETGRSKEDCFDFLVRHPEIVRSKVSYFLFLSNRQFESNEVPSHLVLTQFSNDSQFRLAEGIDLLSGSYLYSLKFVSKGDRPVSVSSESDAISINVDHRKLEGVDAKNAQFITQHQVLEFAAKLSHKLHDKLAINTSMFYSYAHYNGEELAKGSAVDLLQKSGLKTPILEITSKDVPFSDSLIKRDFSIGVLEHCKKEMYSGSVHFVNILNYVKRSNPLMSYSLHEHYQPKYVSTTPLKEVFGSFSKSKLGIVKSKIEVDYVLKSKGKIPVDLDPVD